MQKFNKPFFTFQLAKNRKLILSKTVDGKISMAQEVFIEEDSGRKTPVILKNSFLFKPEIFDEFVTKLYNANQEEKEEGEEWTNTYKNSIES